MTELIPLRQVKPSKPRRSHKRSYKFTAPESSSDSSDDNDDSSSNDESPFIVQLPNKSKKSSKRNNMFQTLPLIINTQPAKQKNKKDRKQIQQFLINAQPPPPSPKKKEIVINQYIEPTQPPEIQYVPVQTPRTPLTAIVQRTPLTAVMEPPPFDYYRPYTPTIIEEHPYAFYDSYEPPVRRIVRYPPPITRNVHLPRHTQKLVNRFIDGIEYAHGHRYIDGSDSDCSIDDCRVCRRLRTVMYEGKRRSNSEIDVYRGSRVRFDTKESHRHRHVHSRDCKVCDLLGKSDLVISTTKSHPTTTTKKRGKHVHVVESYPSSIKPAVETTTTTTTTQPKVVVSNTSVSGPIQSSYYPTSYTGYVDPNTGQAYAYDPNWQYNSSGTGATYDYSSYYNNPAYMQSNLQYPTNSNTEPVVTNPSKQQHTETRKIISPNPLKDKGTYTYMPAARRKHKPANKTVVIHTSRNPTPPTPKIIIKQPRRPRTPRKLLTTTLLKEQTTQTPHTTTTTYVRT